MFAKLQLELECENLTYRQSSNLHGVLMENIDTDYAGYLHSLQWNPFSQSLEVEREKKIWCVNTLTKESYDEIIMPLLKLKEFKIKNNTMDVKVKQVQLTTTSPEELLEEFYQIKGNHFIKVSFNTPTAFKRQGKYVNFPDMQLIYQSLMNRYSAISEDMDMRDEETLEQLVENSEIVGYRLKTVKFPLEKVEIVGFQGDIGIYIRGTDTMARYARMLFRFGEYAGVGIKTSIGMGSIKIR